MAPLVADDKMIGILTVANRLGNVTTFDAQDGRFFETIAAHTSITLQNARLVDRLRHEALHDNLTKLPNRVLFQQRVDRRARASTPADPLTAVMLIDLDRFKEINDTLGHATGDLCCRRWPAGCAARVGERVTVARLGGDEFALLHPGVNLPADAARWPRSVR